MADKHLISTAAAPAAIGPYSQANVTGDFVFTAGQLGLDPETGSFAPGGVQGQTRRALQNISGVLDAAGTDMSHVVKTTVFLADMADFKAMNEIYGEFFSEPYPARSTVAVKELPLGGLVEIDVVAVKP